MDASGKFGEHERRPSVRVARGDSFLSALQTLSPKCIHNSKYANEHEPIILYMFYLRLTTNFSQCTVKENKGH